MPRGRPKSEARRLAILDAAARCFVRAGFHGASMQQICAEAQMSPGALYRYFRSKDELIEAIAESEQQDIEPILRELEKTRDLVASIASAMSEAVVLGADRSYGALVVEVVAEASRNSRVAEILARNDDIMHRALERAISQAQQRGDVDASLPADALAHSVMALWDGLSTRFLLSEPRDVAAMRATVETLVARLLRAPNALES